MPTAPRRVPVVSQPDAVSRRQPIHGIEDMPSGYDAEVAELFRDLRAATALSEMDLAARIGTRPTWCRRSSRARSMRCRLGRDLQGRQCLWHDAQSRCASAAAPHLCPARGGDRRASAEAPSRGPDDDAAQFRRFQASVRRGRRSCAQSPRYSLAAPAAAAEAALAKRGTGRGASGAAPERGPFPQPQNMRPRPQGGPQPSQAWPGGPQAMPQAQRPAPGQRPAPPPAQPDRRPTQPRAAQPQAPQPQPPRQPDLPRPICSRRLSALVPHNRRRPSLKKKAAALAC